MNMEMKSTGIHADNGREKGATGEAERWKGWLRLDAPLTPCTRQSPRAGEGGILGVSGVLTSSCRACGGWRVILPRQEPSGEGWPLLQALGTSLSPWLQEPPKAAQVPAKPGLRLGTPAPGLCQQRAVCWACIAPAPAQCACSACALALLRTPGPSLGTGAEDRLPNLLQTPGGKYCRSGEEGAGIHLRPGAMGPNSEGRDVGRVEPDGSFRSLGACSHYGVAMGPGLGPMCTWGSLVG